MTMSTGFRNKVKRLMLIALITVASVYLLACALAYSVQDGILFPAKYAAPPAPHAPPSAIVLARDIGAGQESIAWFFAAPGASAEAPAPLLVFCHGNAEIIDHQDDEVSAYQQLGFAVLLPEYRGYGRAGGKPSQAAIRDDVLHFIDAARARDDVDDLRLVFHGRSLGGAVAVDAAAHRAPSAIVLTSPFVSVVAMARKMFVPGFIVRNKYRTDQVLPTLDAPVLIFHGLRDEIIPVSHARRLAKLAKDGTLVEFDCGHNDFPGRDYSDYRSRIAAFVEPIATPSTPGSNNEAPGD